MENFVQLLLNYSLKELRNHITAKATAELKKRFNEQVVMKNGRERDWVAVKEAKIAKDFQEGILQMDRYLQDIIQVQLP